MFGTALDQKLTAKIDFQNNELFNVNKRMDTADKQVADLVRENSALKDSVKSLLSRLEALTVSLEELEQYTRSDNLMVFGVPLPIDGSKEGDLTQVVVDTLNRNLGNVQINKEHISIAHRTSANRSTPNAAGHPGNQANRPPPIIVRFSHRETRNNLLLNRRLLKGKPVSISEQLTIRRAQLLRKAGELVSQKKLDSTWSHDGRILVKSTTNRIHVINSDTDLVQYSN